MRQKYEKFDNRFYLELLDYLSSQYPSLHWNQEYDCIGQNTDTYGWWVEDIDVGGSGFRSLKELVEDIFLKIKYFAADY